MAASSSSSSTPLEGDAETQLLHFIETYITPSPEESIQQENILQPFLDKLKEAFEKDSILVKILIAGCRMKNYHIKSRSDFDVLIVFKEGYPIGSTVEASTSEYKIIRPDGTELQTPDFCNKTIIKVNEAAALLDNNYRISTYERAIPLNQFGLEIEHGNDTVECDILSVIPDPQ